MQGALAIARVRSPEIVLLDIGLPGLSGYDVVRQLREDPRTRGATIVAVTGYGQEADRLRALEAGFDQHLVKPVVLSELDALFAA
jgi:CheY-like chemotaxis protein